MLVDGYFNKELYEMTDSECILLAGIPNAPSSYAPTKNLELSKQRQKQVINKMIDNGYLTQEDADKIFISSMHTLHTTEKDPVEIIIWRDVFRYLEQCADACEHVADACEKAYMNNT